MGGFVYSVITNLQGKTWVASMQVCMLEENSHPEGTKFFTELTLNKSCYCSLHEI